MKSTALLAIAAHILVATAQVHPGFCFGSMKGTTERKKYQDYKSAFERMQTIQGAGVTFNSARLFTSIQEEGTYDKPIEAFQAAIDTNTTLLLGIWVDGTYDRVQKELRALDAAFTNPTMGPALAKLVVGLSVGNENIYRASNICAEKESRPCYGAASEDATLNFIKQVRDHISASSYADLLKDKPIGHVDIAALTVSNDVDFVGMTAYPFWNQDIIENAKDSFFESLELVQQKSNGKPIYIAETGWPFSGASQGDATAGTDGMQRYWNEVGCALFGQHNVWWFQLENDVPPNQAHDWAVFDLAGKPRIDFNCPEKRQASQVSAEPPASQSVPAPQPAMSHSTTFATLPSINESATAFASPSPTLAHTPSSIVAPSEGVQTSDPTPPVHLTTVIVTQVECVTISALGNGGLTTKTNLLEDGQQCTPPPLTGVSPAPTAV